MKNFLLKTSILMASFGLLFSPVTTLASQLTDAQISAIISLLQSFGADSHAISNVQTVLHGGTATSTGGVIVKSGSGGLSLIALLHEGDDGENVRILQIALAGDADVYPEGIINGHFGPLTAKAVKRFQKKHGLDQVGLVGPRTREKLNEFLSENSIEKDDDENENGNDIEHRVCAKVPPGHLIAPGWLRKHDGERPIVPPCQKLPPGIEDHMGTSTGTTTPPHVARFNFSLSNGGNKSIMLDGTATNSITALLVTGTSSHAVAFSVSGLPTGVIASSTPASCTPTCTSSLAMYASHAAALGTTTVSITATDGILSRMTSFLLGVRATTTATTTQ